MEELIELLKQIQELSGVAIDALEGATQGGGPGGPPEGGGGPDGPPGGDGPPGAGGPPDGGPPPRG